MQIDGSILKVWINSSDVNKLLENGFVDDLNQGFDKPPMNPVSAHRSLGKES